jgi:sulfoxide reductase heme-binding subunit YedZ
MIKWIGGRRWKKLHMLIYPIALLGIFHFFMMVRADFSRPSIYLIIILVLLGYRFWIKYR